MFSRPLSALQLIRNFFVATLLLPACVSPTPESDLMSTAVGKGDLAAPKVFTWDPDFHTLMHAKLHVDADGSYERLELYPLDAYVDVHRTNVSMPTGDSGEAPPTVADLTVLFGGSEAPTGSVGYQAGWNIDPVPADLTGNIGFVGHVNLELHTEYELAADTGYPKPTSSLAWPEFLSAFPVPVDELRKEPTPVKIREWKVWTIYLGTTSRTGRSVPELDSVTYTLDVDKDYTVTYRGDVSLGEGFRRVDLLVPSGHKSITLAVTKDGEAAKREVTQSGYYVVERDSELRLRVATEEDWQVKLYPPER